MDSALVTMQKRTWTLLGINTEYISPMGGGMCKHGVPECQIIVWKGFQVWMHLFEYLCLFNVFICPSLYMCILFVLGNVYMVISVRIIKP